MWLDEPSIAPVDDSVKQRIDAAARALAKAGAKLDFKARPNFDPLHAHHVYLMLLHSNLAARRADHADLVAARARLRDDDLGDHAMALRASTASYKEVFDAQQQRERLRWAWHQFFGRHDLLLMPITATAAFPHDQSEPMPARRMRINGAEHPTSRSCSGPGWPPRPSCRRPWRRWGWAATACRWGCRSSGRSLPTSAPSGWRKNWAS